MLDTTVAASPISYRAWSLATALALLTHSGFGADPLTGKLNRDGRVDYRDAGVLDDLIDDMYGQPWYNPFHGGLGRYRKTANHGPFVHVDVRGFRARWGT